VSDGEFRQSSWYHQFLTLVLQPFPPAKPIFTAFAILLAVCLSPSLIPYHSEVKVCQAIKDIDSSYDALVSRLESIEHSLSRLEIYTKLTHGSNVENYCEDHGRNSLYHRPRDKAC